MEQMLFKELRPNSTLIFDNAAFHNKMTLKPLPTSMAITSCFYLLTAPI